MKINNSIKVITLVLGIACITSVFYTCKNPIKDFKISIKAEATTAPSTIQVFDVTTNTRLNVDPSKYPDGSIPVTLTGKDAYRIYTPGGFQTFSISQGQILISLRNGTNPTPENPIEFNINIDPDGYLSVTYPIKLTSAQPTNFRIGMVSLTNLPKGSTVTTTAPPVTIDTVTKKTTTPIVIKTDTTNNTGGTPPPTTTVTVPIGTQLQDKDGKPIELPKGDTTTILKTELVFFPPTEQALNSFPGGLETSNIQDTSGNNLKEGTLAPAGWINIDMKIGNTDVKNFSTPIIVNMELDASTINPNTDLPYVEGDSINIYSKSEGDENWVLESVESVVKNSNTGKLEVPMSVSHLSVWAAANFSVSCNTKFSLSLTNDDTDNPSNFLVCIYTPSASNPLAKGTLVKSAFISVAPGTTLTTTNQFNNWKPTAGRKYFVQFFEPGNQTALQTIGPTELCGSTPPTYTARPALDKMVFKVSIRCTNGNSVLLPVGTKVYFIDNAVYNNMIVGQGNAQHKVDPSDILPSNPWQAVVADVRTIGGTNYNIITLPSTALVAGSNYRFAVYYDTGLGTSGSREDKIFPEMGTVPGTPTQAQDPTGLSGPTLTAAQLESYKGAITLIPVTLSSCPF